MGMVVNRNCRNGGESDIARPSFLISLLQLLALLLYPPLRFFFFFNVSTPLL